MRPSLPDQLEHLAAHPGTLWVSMIDTVLRRAAREIRRLEAENARLGQQEPCLFHQEDRT